MFDKGQEADRKVLRTNTLSMLEQPKGTIAPPQHSVSATGQADAPKLKAEQVR